VVLLGVQAAPVDTFRGLSIKMTKYLNSMISAAEELKMFFPILDKLCGDSG